MAILQRAALYPSQRYDVPDARAIEAFVQNDFRFLIQGALTKTSVVATGFEITNFQNIFSVQGIRISQNNLSILHPEATTQACGFYVSAGTESDAELVLSANTTNYVEVDFTNILGTPDVRGFWQTGGGDGTKGSEYTATVDTVIDLNVTVTSNTSGFTAGKIPLYKIVTNADRVATTVTDCRPMLFRLGTGGSSPDAFHSYQYSSRFENPSSTSYASSNANNQVFLGGDKDFKSLKDWMDAVMTGIKEINSTPFWYMAPNASLAQVYMNAAMTTLQGGHWTHEPGVPGKIKLDSGSVIVRFGHSNSTLQPFADVNLATFKTMFVMLTKDGSAASYGMGQDGVSPIKPRTVLSTLPAEIAVGPSGNYVQSGGTVSIRGVNFAYTSFNPTTNTFSGVSPDPQGLAKAGDHVTQATANGLGYYQQAAPGNLPSIIEGISENVENCYWLCHFDGVNTIIIRDSELVPGESAATGDDNSDQLYQYIGSTGAADNFPIYEGEEPNLHTQVQVQTISPGTNLTDAITTAYLLLEKKIYQESIFSNIGWASGSVVYLPDHSKYLPAVVPARYSLGTDELEVSRDGVRLLKGYDYTELSSNSIQLTRDVFAETTLTFRVSQVGGAGAASGGAAGVSQQQAYNNGEIITTAPNVPLRINASAQQTVLWLSGDLKVEGAITSVTTEEFNPQSANPVALGNVGLWVSTDATNPKLMYTRADGTILPVGSILELIGGSAASLSIMMKNSTGATLPVGVPVYISAAGEVALADTDSPVAHRFFGITAQTIANGATGKIIYQGVVPGILAGTGMQAGAYVWLGDTPGLMQDIAPSTSGSFLIIIGICNGDDLILQQQTNGQIS